MENDKEGSAFPIIAAADFEFAAHGGNREPKFPDAVDEIEVLRVAKRNLEDLQLQIAHLPHPPTHSSLQPYHRRLLAGNHLPCRLCRDVHRLLDLLQRWLHVLE
jgi:hypothetical protein